ncbi:hypothetical protein CH306_02380 [Rhodococcus sp. 15-725-2-2b]|uniref:cupin domain-containing protein n=1 Tax=unclassified Rhodococcus (in: high G+C Gram-positive bacteria) TaxID=192944 RepID=UPI000B9B5304|nr:MULTISPECIES: cupin domain-containing protein [unclassified Rhodococcus (in: high G+C Gram-positive bacteria)]OZE03955.1 hypothetical protein CH249_26685 [Rhodococcus sp. 05-2255-3B1]OZE10025.1 hypothetical protein CH250_14040 [Rhodococcus sp. 05-2255-3C]OZE15792.1 hypothetical protein CH255_21065 [Rhodococcus sp. 05-2255-2A2]OZC72544.1 hypothetical protein CH277_00655 [Rhodococcus sp. 06-469-3-2]OZD48770.1 hypothetical protein CH264_05880 [Rhodococcus sp. 06-1477-1A]
MPDAQGSFELFHVVSGVLTLMADGEVATVGTGESARLRSDRIYRYVNDESVPTTFFRTVVLAR